MSHNELYHYGVLGMKWGIHRARKNQEKYSNKAAKQNEAAKELNRAYTRSKKAGNVEAAANAKKAAQLSRERAKGYEAKAKNSTYEYKSHSTKKYEKKAAIAKESAKEWDEIAAYKKSINNKKQADSAKKSAKKDREAAKKFERRAKRSAMHDKNMQTIAEKTRIGDQFVANYLFGSTQTTAFQRSAASGETYARSVIGAFLGGPAYGYYAKSKYIRKGEKK